MVQVHLQPDKLHDVALCPRVVRHGEGPTPTRVSLTQACSALHRYRFCAKCPPGTYFERTLPRAAAASLVSYETELQCSRGEPWPMSDRSLNIVSRNSRRSEG